MKNGIPLNDVITRRIYYPACKINCIARSAFGTNYIIIYTAVNDVYTEATKLVVLLKVDLSSALGIKISFQDDDGD